MFVVGVAVTAMLLIRTIAGNTLSYNAESRLSNTIYGKDKDHVLELRTGDTSKSTIREKAAIVALVMNTELEKLKYTIRQFEERWNSKYNYPYVFFNDIPFSDDFKEGIQAVTNANVTYVDLSADYWSIPAHVDLAKVIRSHKKNKSRFIYGGKLSYQLMCRFQSLGFYNHPALASYKYYWRIEPDVGYFCDINYDPFHFMAKNGLKYGFTIAIHELANTVETLWTTTVDWVLKNKDMLPEENNAKWILRGDGDYNGCHYWSNFEIVDMDFYRSKEYTSYVDYLDLSGGFFYERWGDAPIHSIAASLLLPKEKLFWFDDIGYRHDTLHICPTNKNLDNNCVCDMQGSLHDYECLRNWRNYPSTSKQYVLSHLSKFEKRHRPKDNPDYLKDPNPRPIAI
ncbi:Glycolipid 2-alpha-mannosyltransferase [Zancudomyces culisetae]|uniref:Glycolipid 2-alpha-mannosyltransferase n=1 Tax=Zancudomyces culisetae TaxID=1213189 RepID=A0A1R1PWG0_ZANCU|nr:Glycolipid 2-alpha-mannosyltransferase [Zancudomyces culisetae]|eukprot:OMH85232.1 Glycolipid 2-alpha-mannosyltransferase [Zancudomyces culisetae]